MTDMISTRIYSPLGGPDNRFAITLQNDKFSGQRILKHMRDFNPALTVWGSHG